MCGAISGTKFNNRIFLMFLTEKTAIFKYFTKSLTPSFGCSNHFAPAKLDSVEHLVKRGVGWVFFYEKRKRLSEFFAVSCRDCGTAFAEVNGKNYR